MDENVKNFPLRVQYFHSIFKCADPSVHSKIKGIKDLLDPLSDPSTTLKAIDRRVQGLAKEWSLGCVIPMPWPPLAVGHVSRNLGTIL